MQLRDTLAAMRFAILLALLALDAPHPPVSPALECRLSLADATEAIGSLPVQSHEDFPGEDEYRHTRKFDPAHLSAFGFRVRAVSALGVNAISHESWAVTTTLDAPYETVRAAALASRGRARCADRDGPPGYCVIEERDQGGWTNSVILEEQGGRPALTCLYTRLAP